MSRDRTLRSYILPRALWAASAFVGATLAMPAQAQTAQVEVYGYVAPRCWVANTTNWQPSADGSMMPPRAICNQATPRMESRMRSVAADGTLVQMMPASFDPRTPFANASGRAAMEIVVSPQP